MQDCGISSALGKEILLSYNKPSKIYLHSSLFIPSSKHHDCWELGDARRQDINSHCIDLVLPKYSGLNTIRVNGVLRHYSDVIMGAMASQITSLTIVYSTVYSGIDQRKHQSSASLAFVRGIHRWPVNSPHKGPVMRKMLSLHDVIMLLF